MPGHSNGRSNSYLAPRAQAASARCEELYGDPRPEIIVRPELSAMTDEAIDAIDEANLGIFEGTDFGVYVRGRMLVSVVRDGSDPTTWIRRAPGAPTIRPLDQAQVLDRMDRAARWRRPGKDDQAERKPVMPPPQVAAQVLARPHWPFPYLDAVVETPTIRPDGTILSVPGHDRATGLLYQPAPGEAAWPAVPTHPTRSQVEEAVRALLDPVRDFPFVATSDRAAYVAVVLTLIARHCVAGAVPMFAVRAPAPGTGKSLFVAVTGLIGTGREPATMTMTGDGDELRKRVLSIALSGTPAVTLDNASGVMGSDVLAAFLTATDVEDRILGRSEMVRVPLRVVWMTTGNNLGFKATLGRRVVPIDLDANREMPEDRTGFAYPDLLAHVRGERPRLVTAALTILRAFAVAGRPTHGRARMGSFEAWDDAIRSAVVWAGLEDPAGTDDPSAGRARVRAEADSDTEELGALLSALTAAFPNGATFTVDELMRRSAVEPVLRRTLDLVAPSQNGREATNHSVGIRLRGIANRPIGGRRLVRAGETRNHTRQYAIRTTEQEGEMVPF